MSEEVFRDANRSSDPEPGPAMDRFQKGVSQFLAKQDASNARVQGEGIRLQMGGPWTAALLAAVTLAYLYLEARWNVDLVAAVYAGDLPAPEMQALVESGRWLSAFGLAWALTRGVFLRESRSLVGAIVGALLVGATTMACHVGISRGYEAAIDRIPDPVALQLYKSSVWRSMSTSPDAQAHGEAQSAAVLDPVAATLWPLRLLDQRSVILMEAAFETKEGEIRAQLAQRARAAWPEVSSRVAQMGSRDALLSQFETAYQRYIKASEAMGSMFSSVETRRMKGFEQLSGMKPNSKATREQFAQELQRSPIENLSSLGRLYIETAGGTADPIVFERDGIRLQLTDLGNLASEDAFVAHIETKVAAQLEAARSRPGLVHEEKARQAVAAAVLPLVAMTVSLLGMLVNAGALVGIAFSRVPLIGLVPQWCWPLAALALVMAHVPRTAEVPGLHAGLAALREAAPMFSSLFERLITLQYQLMSLAT